MKKPKRPYKPSNENARLLKNCHDAIAEAHEAWGVPDSPEMCLLSETCVPCAICPNAKEKADDRLAPTAGSPVALHQCDGCKKMSTMAHLEVLCPSRVPGCIGTTINYQENAKCDGVAGCGPNSP
jgi:hypothetical protein